MRFLLLLCLWIATPASAMVGRVDALLVDDIGLARTKLALDAMVDETVDVERTLRAVEAWSRVAEAEVPADASVRARVDGLLRVLYVAGAWNAHRPFAYDFDDPFARVARNRLLSTYLETRRGNCVTMPVLFAILGRGIGLTVALARAPHHLFAVVRDDDGTWFNVEATAGGLKSDASYVRDTGISAQALANGLYLRALTREEEIATLAGDVASALSHHGDHETAIALATRMLEIDPNDVDWMVRLGTLHARILDRDFHARWPDPADVPPGRHAEYRERSAANAAWFAKAEALGWRQPTPEEESAYLRATEDARLRVSPPDATRGSPRASNAPRASPTYP
jgi:regulator of sirC expression with transglutaminase-like and TPR domain